MHRRDDRAVRRQQAEGPLMATTSIPPLTELGAQGGDPERPRRRQPRTAVGRALLYLALIVAAVGVLLPFYWMVVSSLKENNDVFTVPIKWIPDPIVWSNYVDIWTKSDMTTWLKNTLVLSITVTFLQVLTGAFAAYGFAKVRFPGRDVLFLVYIGTIAVPWQSYMIPQFILFSKLHLSNTLWSIIALQAFGAFGVFLMKQFFETIPEDLSEAARIDGLSEYGIWRRIMLPLSIPALASLALLTFTNTWNDYLGPLIYLRSPNLWTIQLGLRTFIDQYNAEYSLIFAGSVISVLPIALLFMFGQRYFIEGIATSGMKG
jgi:multiple sugar transport system permease protein